MRPPWITTEALRRTRLSLSSVRTNSRFSISVRINPASVPLQVALQIDRRIRPLHVALVLLRRQRGVDDRLGSHAVLLGAGVELVAVCAGDRYYVLVPAHARAERPHHVGGIEDV